MTPPCSPVSSPRYPTPFDLGFPIKEQPPEEHPVPAEKTN